ncbi:MAG TPA: hypothetical protein VE198_15920 [Actinoallomurus sp.]|nr:hypothetical protein [Actinoallomurus sp.]
MEAPKDTVQLPPYDRQRVPLPDHKVVEMNGLEGMLAKTVNSLEGQDVTVGREARTQLRHLLVAEPKDHLKVLAGRPRASALRPRNRPDHAWRGS